MHFFCVCIGDRIIVMGNDCGYFSLSMAFGGADEQKTLNPTPAPSGHTGSIPQGPRLRG